MEVHRARHFKLVPPTIQAFAVSPQLLAVLREDSSVVVFKLSTWTQVAAFPGNFSLDLRKLEWLCDDELLAVGTSGYMVKWSLHAVEPVVTSKVNGGGVWDLAVADSTVYLACDDGRLRSYYVDAGELVYRQKYQRQNCKLLCVKALQQNIFAGGSDGGIYKYVGGKPTAALRIANTSAVLSLAILNDLTVVSGDFEGCVKFWEGKFGTLRHNFNTHEADILAITATEDCVYASGVDSKVMKFCCADGRWVLASKARGQSHDVRTLAWTGSVLLSGGVTSDVCLYPDDLFESEGEMKWNEHLDTVVYKRKRIRHIGTLPCSSCISSRVLGKTLVTAFNNSKSIEVWLTDQLAHRVTKVFHFKPSGAAAVTSVALSPDCTQLAYATIYSTRLVQIDLEARTTQLAEAQLPPAIFLRYSARGLVGVQRKLWTYLDGTLATLAKYDSLATHMEVFEDSIAVRLYNNSVTVYRPDQTIHLPQLEATITALGFVDLDRLYLANENNQILGFSLETLELDKYSKKFSHKLPANFLNDKDRIIGLQRFNATSIIVNSHYSYSVIDLTVPPPSSCQILPKRMFEEHKASWSGKLSLHPLHSKTHVKSTPGEHSLFANFSIVKRFGPIIGLEVSESVLSVAELDWQATLDRKPLPLATHKYGA